jgi:hypothetical protein
MAVVAGVVSTALMQLAKFNLWRTISAACETPLAYLCQAVAALILQCPKEVPMSRPRQRVCLQDGLKLDLNQLARKGFIKRGANSPGL